MGRYIDQLKEAGVLLDLAGDALANVNANDPLASCHKQVAGASAGDASYRPQQNVRVNCDRKNPQSARRRELSAIRESELLDVVKLAARSPPPT